MGTGVPPASVSGVPLSDSVNSCPVSRMSARSSAAPDGAVNTTSTQVEALSTSTLPPLLPGPPRSTPGWPVVAVGSAASNTSKVTSLPEEFRNPIFSLPYRVSRRTWSGMSARNSTVALPWATLDRSTYRRPESESWSARKFSLPMISTLPSVEILRITWPLNSCSEV